MEFTRWFSLMIFGFALATYGKETDGAGEKAKEAVVQTFILDGIWGSHSRWERLRARIETEVGPCRIWRYDNSGFTSLEAVGRKLSEELEAAGTPLNLIGYSMGGIVIREALRQDPALPVRRVALLHSPHAGTLSANLLPLTACREMRPGSAFLRRLDAAPWSLPTFVTWCPWDLMILPGRSARWHRSTEALRADFPAHDWPIRSKIIHQAVLRFLSPAMAEGHPPTAALARP